MSRRKQSNPRQFKRSLGEMEETEENLALESNQSERDGSVSDPEELAECSDSSASYSEEPEGERSGSVPQLDQEMGELDPLPDPCGLSTRLSSPAASDGETPEAEDGVNYQEAESPLSTEEPSETTSWNGPDELVLETSSPDGVSQVRAETELPKGFTWGPYRGNFMGPSSPDQTDPGGALSMNVDDDCWFKNLTLVSCELEANSVLYWKGDQIWCKTSKVIERGEVIRAFLMAEPQAIPNVTIKEEPGESSQEMPTQPEFQLLPQQAGMAAILATAVVNKDIFPCKDCGIWYRSERNLQAHLMYYCASRQNSTSPSAAEEKPKDSYPNERVCPFPLCKKSCPSASSLEIHMRSHSGERPFVCLICLSAFTTKANCERHLKVHTDTLNGVCHGCGFISTTRDILYSHLVTNHMICQPGSKVEVFPVVKTLAATKPTNSAVSQMSSSSLLKCGLCGFLADCLSSLQQHMILHATASVSVTSPTSRSSSDAENEQPHDIIKNGDSKSPAHSSNSGVEDTPLKVQIKEEPDALRSIGESASNNSEAKDDQALVASPAVKVKTEISSPTPGSSPVPESGPAAAGGGTVLLPQYVFGHEAPPAILPQASEILAKMSELVHNRLKQGQPVASVGFSGTPVQKGATCFECEITFNNINNYYVHKRLYCSGRHVTDEGPAGGGRKIKVTPVRAAVAPGASALPAVEDPQTSPSQEESGGESSTTAIKIKVEEGVGVENEASSSGQVSEGSQSPNSLDDTEEDPTRTVCAACNIRFSRHETYVVHKRYYCASRHDPPLRRAGVTGKPGLQYTPQTVPRTRKRRKLYEIHGVSPAEVSSQALLSLNRLEALPIMPGLIPAPAMPSPSSSPDAAEGPIDLSKKPRLQVEMPLPTPAAAATAVVPLTDYHECTACRISFNSLETYLAHKKFSCPVAPLQQKALQQLQKIKSPLNASGKIGEEAVRVKVERRTSPGSDSMQPVAVPCVTVPDIKALQQYTAAESSLSSTTTTTTTCPYCPPNVVIRGDLLEHFRSVHGLLLAKPTAGHRLQAPYLEVLVPARVHPSSVSESSLPSPPASSTSPLQVAGPQKDSKEAASSSPSSFNGSPASSSTPHSVLTSTPRPQLPSSPALPLNPAADTRREDGLRVSTQALLPGDKAIQPPKSGLSPAVPNGNHRYCRLCNIKFSSLSTFIAHKKYYCSSHAAEHVK